MQKFQDIDQLFNEKLRSASVESASSGGWTALSSQLDKVGIVAQVWSLLWVKITTIGAAAVIVATILTLSLSNFNSNNSIADNTNKHNISTQAQNGFDLDYSRLEVLRNLNLITRLNNNYPSHNPISKEVTGSIQNSNEFNYVNSEKKILSTANAMHNSSDVQMQNPQSSVNGSLLTKDLKNEITAGSVVPPTGQPVIALNDENNEISSKEETIESVNFEKTDETSLYTEVDESENAQSQSLENNISSDTKILSDDSPNTSEPIVAEQLVEETSIANPLATESSIFTNLSTESISLYDLPVLNGMAFNGLMPPSALPITFPSSKERKQRRNNYAISAYYSQMINRTDVSTADSEFRTTADQLQNGISETGASTIGLGVSTNFRHLYLETGISLTEIDQNENYFWDRYTFTDNSFWDVNSYSITSFDTIGYYYQYVNNDSIWVPVVKEITNHYSDSSFVSKIDTAQSRTDTLFSNQYKYLEIPLIAGYMFSKGKTDFIAKTGVYASLLNKVEAYSIAGSDETSVYVLQKSHFPSISFDLYASLEARYHISSRYFIFGDVFYRKPINSFYSWQGLNRESSKYGIKMGMGIYF
jgi:hypothetical protein